MGIPYYFGVHWKSIYFRVTCENLSGVKEDTGLMLAGSLEFSPKVFVKKLSLSFAPHPSNPLNCAMCPVALWTSAAARVNKK